MAAQQKDRTLARRGISPGENHFGGIPQDNLMAQNKALANRLSCQ